MTTKEVLTNARAKIEKPENWLVGSAYNGNGAYCAIGAVRGASDWNNDNYVAAIAALDARIEGPLAVDPYNPLEFSADAAGRVARFNNTKGHECVLSLFDAAIERQP